MQPTKQQITSFQATVLDYFSSHGRDLPWRQLGQDGTVNPYHVLVSEIMLQQTQVSRVVPKYQQFLEQFPTIAALAQADLAQVLLIWSGLGYNRRAKYLWQAAKQVEQSYGGQVPETEHELIKLPGIGKNTAAAIAAYSWNQPVVFIETNIRSVYIHHFFSGQKAISDEQLLPYVEQTLPKQSPRQWYWALMDYGTFLKSTVSNPSRNSKHHAQQSQFEGSLRQLRGAVLKQLLAGPQTYTQLAAELEDDRLEAVLKQLIIEELVGGDHAAYHLGK